MSRILIVDDTRDSLELLAKLLRAHGHTIECASDGHQALESLLHSRPDMIVLDIMMPVMDGVDFLRYMRSNPEWSGIRVIVFTGRGGDYQTRELAELGVEGILLKGSSDIGTLVKLVS
jgi:two-component system response regulator CpxR